MATPARQEEQPLDLSHEDMLDPDMVEVFRSREEGIRAAMSYASIEALSSGDIVEVNVCQGAGKCRPGTDPRMCPWCERITCLPSGEIKHCKPEVC